MQRKQPLIKLLTILTLLFIFGEIAFVVANLYATGFGKALRLNAGSVNFLHPNIMWPVLQYLSAQVILYAALIYLLWYVTTSLQTLFRLNEIHTKILAVLLFTFTITAILQANSYYSPHSFYAAIISYHAFIFFSCISVIVVTLLLTLIAIINDLLHSKHLLKHVLQVSLCTLVIGASFNDLYSTKTVHSSKATAEHPNVFIIGFDALRPDYLSYFNGHGGNTPNFDAFLNQSVVFKEGYASAARTFVSWVSILTGKHPLHSGAREDNITLGSLQLGTTLPQYLKQAGYHTVYVSDDNRFNNINHTMFGFEQISGPPGDISDFIISYCNDFPISNLLLSTRVGKLLFPHHYAHHGSPHIYQPRGFIEQLDSVLRTEQDKPLFMAAFFNVTGWPFYYFGDRSSGFAEVNSLKNVVQVSDQQFGSLLTLLDHYGYLNHAIFIVLSDHGITTGMPNERLVRADTYRGDKHHMKKLTYYRYASEHGTGELGIDTSWGYGSDVLSLQQNHFLFALRGFGVTMPPHQVAGRMTLMDILPTVLDLVHLPLPSQIDGISLHKQIMGAGDVGVRRPLFIESCYSNATFMRENEGSGQALGNLLGNFYINPVSGLVSFNDKALPDIYAKKQRAVWDGDWYLAQYPASIRTGLKLLPNHQIGFQLVKMPPYSVLVNTKSGEWTTELNNKFAANAPVKKLQMQLREFYSSSTK